MVKSGSFLLPVAVLMLSFAIGQAAFAGPVPSGEGVAVVRPSGGTNLVITDPARDGNGAGYVFSVFGATGDTIVCGDWDGDGNDSIGAVRADGSAALWIRDYDGAGDIRYDLFGDATDIPVVGDWNPSRPGDEIGVVRPGGGTLNWILQDQSPNGCECSQTFFGLDTDLPAPGNWDSDAGNGDEIGVTRDASGTKLWITVGSGGLDYTLFGATGDPNTAGDYNGLGDSVIGVSQETGTSRYFWLDSVTNNFVLLGLDTDVPANCGGL